MNGKISIDATNPYKQDGTGLALPETTSGAAELQHKLPLARVVKASNSLPVKNLCEDNDRQPASERLILLVNSDDSAAKETLAKLIADSGFAAVDLGGLDRAEMQEPRGRFYAKPLTITEARNLSSM